MSSFISAAPVASGQVQSLDSVRGHSLPSDAMILASATQVNPTNQNTGSYAIVESGVNSLGVTTTGIVPAVTASPFADLYKEGSVYLNGTTGNYLQNTATYSNLSINWATSGMTIEAWVNYPTFVGASFLITANPIPTLFAFSPPTTTTGIFLGFGANTSGYVNFYYFNPSGGLQTVMGLTQLSTNTWNHIAMTCTTSGQIYLFVNGVQTQVVANRSGSLQAASFYETFQGTFASPPNGIILGQVNSTNTNAYVADLRLTTGTPLYTGSTSSYATFTVPSAPLSSTTSPGVTQFLLRAGQNSPTIQNGALTFDRGLRQYANFGPLTLNPYTRGFSVVFRYTWNGIVANNERILQFTQSTSSPNNSLAILRNGTGSSVSFSYYNNSGTPTTVTTTGTLSQSVTYVLALVYSTSGAIQWWVNGAPNASGSLVLSADPTLFPYTFVGCDYTGAGSFTSITSNTLAIYNRALSNVEIYNSYLALNTVPATPLQKTLEIGDINGTPALSVAGNGQVSVQSIGLTSNVVQWPPSALQGYDTVINGGVYKARASNESFGNLAWYPFQKTNAIWQTSYPVSGVYNGTVVTTDVNGTAYPGDWLQLQLPNQINLTGFSMYTAGGGNSPIKFVVLGSRDGVNWVLVSSQNYNGWVLGQTSTFSVSSVQSFNYYRLCIQVGGNYPAISNFILYGTADASPALTIAPATTFNTSVATPSLVGVVNNASFVPQDFSSSGLNIPAYVVSNTATVANTVAYSSFGPFAGEGSFQFPGAAASSGAYINFPASTPAASMTPVTAFTAETFLYLAGTPTPTYCGVFDSINTIGGSENWGLNINGTNATFFIWPTSGGVSQITGSATLINSWFHIAVSYDGTTLRLFINGALANSTAMVGTPRFAYGSIFIIGTNGVFRTGCPMYMADARIVTGTALYVSAFTPPTTPLQPIQGTTQAGLPYGTVLLLRNAPAPGRIQTTRLTGSNSGSVLSFPPAPMTGYSTALNAGYGQGTYVASASSELSGQYAWLAFDASLTIWTSATSTYTASTGVVVSGGPTTVDINGNSYQGEWLQIQKPSSIVLASYSLLNRSDITTQSPNKFWVLGSRDGTNWYLVDSRTGITWSLNQTQVFTVSTSQAFTYYRMVTNTINSGTTQTQVSIATWTLNGQIEGLNINPDGKIGIGLANPTRALEVAGDVVCGGTLSAGNPLMFRNALYNGDMRIAQRGTSFTNPAGQYTLDRWYITTYGALGNGTVSQIQSGLANFSNAFQLATTSTTSGNWYISQSLETRDVVRFQGQPVTVSFWYKIPTSFSTTWSSGLYWTPSVDTAITNPVSPAPNSAGGITLTNTTQWTYVQFQSFIPLTAQALSIIFSNFNNVVNGATIQITGVQLEKGSVATPYEILPYATELALCQRYWEQSYALGTAAGTNTSVGVVQLYGSSDSGGNMVATQRYQVAKRITVTPTIYTPSGTSGSWTYGRSGASGNGTINDNSYSTVFGYNFYIAVGAAWVPCFIQGHWVANAEF
jgi:hypothetical protein